MDFKDLQKDLRDRKLNITEYFMWMFRVLRVFILENKLWVMFLVLTNILTGIMPLNFVKKYIFISIALVFYGRIFIFISYAKVLHRIESTESKYKFKSLILKYLKLLLVMNRAGIFNSYISTYSILYSDIYRKRYEHLGIFQV